MWYQRGLGPEPDVALLLHLAEAQLASNDPASAGATLTRILEKHPLNRAARALLRKIP
jgi:hypothetical protein